MSSSKCVSDTIYTILSRIYSAWSVKPKTLKFLNIKY